MELTPLGRSLIEGSLTSNEEIDKIIINLNKGTYTDLQTFNKSTESEDIPTFVKTLISSLPQELLFVEAFGLLRLFAQLNYTGPETDITLPNILKTSNSEDVLMDGEGVLKLVKVASALPIVEMILRHITSYCSSVGWWLARALMTHQRILDERSQLIWKELQVCIAKPPQGLSSTLQALFEAEAAQAYLYYYDLVSANKRLTYATEYSKMKIEVKGVMGKRTKFQQTSLSQLLVKVEAESDNDEPKFNQIDINNPQVLRLDDEVRLDEIAYENKAHSVSMLCTPAQLAVLHAHSEYIEKSRAPDGTLDKEENLAWITTILRSGDNWPVKIKNLIRRSLLEKHERRTVDRSMRQLETVQASLKGVEPDMGVRFPLHYAVKLPMIWEVEIALGIVEESLGCNKAALSIYIRLGLTEETARAYTAIGMRHKAEEVLLEELAKNESIKTLCLLGDATDDVSFYARAWKLSKHRSGRAQRCWGYLLFKQQKYEEALEHLHLSVELNPLEALAWLRLGFAALRAGNYELSAKAYRHYTLLDTDSFQAWNNLAQSYLHLKDKPRALRALQEATKVEYEVWQLWENIIVVASDIGSWEAAIGAYHRLIDLKKAKIEDEILKLMSIHAVEAHRPALLKLFGRVATTAQPTPAYYSAYAQVLSATGSSNDDLLRGADFAVKAITCHFKDPLWSKEPKKIQATIEDIQNLSIRILNLEKNEQFGEEFNRLASVSLFHAEKAETVLGPDQIYPKLNSATEELRNIIKRTEKTDS